MKKTILAVILVAAIGGAAYWLLQKKKQNAVIEFKQEQIIGKWKLDFLAQGKDSASLFVGIMGMIDSNIMKYDYDFRKEGIVVKFLKDSVQKDTTHYELKKTNQLIWKEQGDSTGQALAITTLNTDSLVLKTKDSTIIYFKKAK
jgi:hypothetical protein